MRKLATLALLVSALLTGACTDDPDTLAGEVDERETHELTADTTVHLPHPNSDTVIDHPAPVPFDFDISQVPDKIQDGQPAGQALDTDVAGQDRVGGEGAIGAIDCRNINETGPDVGEFGDDRLGQDPVAAAARPPRIHADEPASAEVVQRRIRVRSKLLARFGNGR